MTKALIISGNNPSKQMLQALKELTLNGDELAPRGKKIKELRPVTIELTDGRKCMTYVKGRTINPFFQLFESAIWIASGRADVDTLAKYNDNMRSFSDDGITFNAPYGERMRDYGKNSYRDIEGTGLDQLRDCYAKLLADPDTRQAVLTLNNPTFDSSNYTLNGGKDIACNLILTFKLRQGHLDLTVFNRSNDVIWGTWGANLYQFSTILRLMAGWLGVPVGSYCQITDSLHIYTEDYAKDALDKIAEAYPNMYNSNLEEVWNLHYDNPTVPKLTIYETDDFLTHYWDSKLHATIHVNPEDIGVPHGDHFECVTKLIEHSVKDDYYKDVLYACYAYQLYKRGMFIQALASTNYMTESYEKIACLNFLFNPKLLKCVNSDWIRNVILTKIKNPVAQEILESKLSK